jgi:spore germination protein YaaH
MLKRSQLTCRVICVAPIISALLVVGSGCRAQRSESSRTAEFWAFAAPWDRASDAAIAAHGSKLNAVVTGWIGLDSLTGRPLLPSPYADTIRARDAGRMAMVTSWHGDRFHQRSIRMLAADPVALARTATAIATHAREMGYTGLVLDFETLEARDLEGQLTVVRRITEAARKSGVKTIAVAVPATDTVAYPARPLLRFVDVIIPMLYDQHWSGSQPGPLSAPDWVRGALAVRVAEAGAQRIVAGLPTYGYRWRKELPTQDLGYAEAQAVAARSGIPLLRDSATGTLRARAPDWEMWVTDAQLLQRLVRESQQLGVNRFALWRLGREDPAVWQRLIK